MPKHHELVSLAKSTERRTEQQSPVELLPQLRVRQAKQWR